MANTNPKKPLCQAVKVCGEEGMQALLDKLYTYIQTCDVTWGRPGYTSPPS